MTDFKVGDRVMYTGRHSGYVSRTMIDQHGTVTNLENASIRVQWDSGKKFGVFRENIEPITPDVITINRADLPEVTVINDHLLADKNIFGRFLDADGHRKMALSQLAVAEYLAHEKAAKEAAAEGEAERKRTKRRDELAAELAPRAYASLGANWYGNVGEPLQKAIDRIIELENKDHE